MILAKIATAQIIGMIIVFCRVTALLGSVPLFGEIYLPGKTRLLLCVIVSHLVYTTQSGMLEPMVAAAMESAGYFAMLIVAESLLGYALGFITKLMYSTIHTLGFILANQSGLSNAAIFDPMQRAEGTVLSNGLSMFAAVLMLSLNLHVLFIKGVVASYELFAVGGLNRIVADNLFEKAAQTMAKTWLLALQIAAPAIVASVVLMFGSGILSRLMPQLQIFFIIMPLQVLLGLVCFAFTISYMLVQFVAEYGDFMGFMFKAGGG